jgi:hypothetical protein
VTLPIKNNMQQNVLKSYTTAICNTSRILQRQWQLAKWLCWEKLTQLLSSGGACRQRGRYYYTVPVTRMMWLLVFACFISTAGWISMELAGDFIPLQTVPNSFYFSLICVVATWRTHGLATCERHQRHSLTRCRVLKWCAVTGLRKMCMFCLFLVASWKLYLAFGLLEVVRNMSTDFVLCEIHVYK